MINILRDEKYRKTIPVYYAGVQITEARVKFDMKAVNYVYEKRQVDI